MATEKILHIRSSYFYGGPERQITYLTRVLAGMGIDSGVATFAPRYNPSRNAYASALEKMGQAVHRMDIDGSFDRMPLGTLETIIRENGYTVLVGHDYRADYFVLKLSGASGLPALSFSRGWTQNSLRVRFYEWLDIRFLRQMDGVVAVSQAKYTELRRKGIAADKLIQIPNSILTDNPAPRQNLIRNRFGIPHDAFLVGTAGRLSPEKNQEVFIRAALTTMVSMGGKAPWFIIAGEGKRKDELAAMIPEQYRNRIILAGWIEDSDAFYADIDLFVLTSLTEGFPNVLLEAGKYNRPVISTPAGGAIDIISDSETGLLMPFGDSLGLNQRIERLARDAAYRTHLGEALGVLTSREFDADVNAHRFLEFMRAIKERHGKD